jgi:hypothetical protein
MSMTQFCGFSNSLGLARQILVACRLPIKGSLILIVLVTFRSIIFFSTEGKGSGEDP